MSDTQPTRARRPRSEARRMGSAGPGEQPRGGPAPTPVAQRAAFPRAVKAAPTPPPPSRVRHESAPAYAPARSDPRDALAFEDTSTVLTVPEQRAFLVRQPPIFWIAASLLMVALFAVLLAVGLEAWREAEIAREESRRLRLIAEEKAKYKLLHRDLIEAYAASNEIDPALVAAVIYHESRFNPAAVSSVGARGLMQIMKETGEWIAEKLGETGTYTRESLFIPETNIRFGTWYLGFLSRMFDGDMVKMAAGYHAGQSRVLEWLSNPEYSSDGIRLEKIPYPDTEQYVNRVVNAYEIYTRHYYTPEDAPAPELAS